MSTRLLRWSLFIALAFCACKKEQKKVVPTPPVPDSPMMYTIFDLRDTLAVYEDSMASLKLNIYRASGKAEQLRLSMHDLPQGLIATLLPDSGIPPFSTNLRFEHQSALAGFYKLALKSKVANRIETRNIVVNIIEICHEGLPGQYQNHQTINDNTYRNLDSTSVTIVAATAPNKLVFKNLFFFKEFASDVYATVNCANKTLTLTSNNFMHPASGTGSFTDSTIYLQMKVLTDAEQKSHTSVNCTLKRK